MNPATPLNAPIRLQATTKAGNIAGLTKKHHTQCQALNMAFFMPKIRAFFCAMGLKDRNRISKYGRVKAQNTRPFNGNMCSRVMRLSDTRPPVTKAGGLTKKHHGGHSMPHTSQAPTIGQFSFTIQLPADSYINSLIANYSCNTWQLWIETTKGQTRPILNAHDQSIKNFETLDSLAFWLGSQGFSKMAVYLPESKTQPAGSDLTGGAE